MEDMNIRYLRLFKMLEGNTMQIAKLLLLYFYYI